MGNEHIHQDPETKALVPVGDVYTIVPNPNEAGVLTQAGTFATVGTEDVFDSEGKHVGTIPEGDQYREQINSLFTS